jgi:hypothetical protein
MGLALGVVAAALVAWSEYDNPNGWNLGFGVNCTTGRTLLVKHASAQVIYCNPAHGSASDANAGTNPALPKLTPAAAFGAARTGFGDWVLFPQNTTISKGFGNTSSLNRNGHSLPYPSLCSTYDPADPTNFDKMRKGVVTFDVPNNEYPFWSGFSTTRTRLWVMENLKFTRSVPPTDGTVATFSTAGNNSPWAYSMWTHCLWEFVPSGTTGGSHQIYRHCSMSKGRMYGSVHGSNFYLDGSNSAAGANSFIDDYVAFRITQGSTPFVTGDSFTFNVTGGVAGAVTPNPGNTGNNTLLSTLANPIILGPDQTFTVTFVTGTILTVTGSVTGLSDVTVYVHPSGLTNGNTYSNVFEYCVGFHGGWQGDLGMGASGRDHVSVPVTTVTGIAASAVATVLGGLDADLSGFTEKWFDNIGGTHTGTLTAWVSLNKVNTDTLSVNNQGTGAGQIGRSGSTITYEGNTIGTVSGTYTGVNGATLQITFTTAFATDTAVDALSKQITYVSTAGTPSGTRSISLLLMSCDHAGVPDIFKHNFYFSSRTYKTVFRNNVSAHGCSHGLHLRGGGICKGNLFIKNPIGIQLGGGDNYNDYRSTGVDLDASRNTLCGSSDIRVVQPIDLLPRGFAFGLINTRPTAKNTAMLLCNVGSESTTNIRGFTEAAFNIPTDGVVKGLRQASWGSTTWAAVHALAAFPAQVLVTYEDSILDNQAPSGSNTNSAGLAVPYRDATRDEDALVTYLGYADREAMWADVVTKPGVKWASRMKPFIDWGFNMA